MLIIGGVSILGVLQADFHQFAIFFAVKQLGEIVSYRLIPRVFYSICRH